MIKGKSYDSSHNGSRIADSAKVSQNTRNFYKLSNKLNEIDYRGHLLTLHQVFVFFKRCTDSILY